MVGSSHHSGSAPATRLFGGVAASALIVLASNAPGHATDVLAPQIAAVAAQLDPRVAPTLARLEGTGRQLLALRSYVRGASHLAERWSWTEEQIAAFAGSPEQIDMQKQIDRVREVFTRDNPGFELYVNPVVRSLDTQIEHWNSNASVTAAAADMLAAAQALIVSPVFPADRPERAREAFKAFLSARAPVPMPTIAAPGLSLHGQMRAIDFQVHQRGRIVAGPSSSTIAADWESAGWAAKLDAAVREASHSFVGPSTSPPAPWHYTYVPQMPAEN